MESCDEIDFAEDHHDEMVNKSFSDQKLLDIIRCLPLLWYPRHEYAKDLNRVKSAWRALADALDTSRKFYIVYNIFMS